MPTNRRSRRRRRASAGTLTVNQVWHLDYGRIMLDGPKFPFDSEEHRRACWEAHREELMAGQQVAWDLSEGTKPSPGWRPLAFWQYDAPEKPRNRELHVDALRRMGLLTAQEEREWAFLPELPDRAVYYDPDDPRSSSYESREACDAFYAKLEADRLALRARLAEDE